MSRTLCEREEVEQTVEGYLCELAAFEEGAGLFYPGDVEPAGYVRMLTDAFGAQLNLPGMESPYKTHPEVET